MLSNYKIKWFLDQQSNVPAKSGDQQSNVPAKSGGEQQSNVPAKQPDSSNTAPKDNQKPAETPKETPAKQPDQAQQDPSKQTGLEKPKGNPFTYQHLIQFIYQTIPNPKAKTSHCSALTRCT
jgi:hypothetical protein